MDSATYYMIGSYLLTFIAGIVLIAYYQGNFFINWFRVKTSKDKKVLVRVLTMTDDYFRVGQIDEGILVFKDRLKETRRNTIGKKGIYRSMMVNCIDIDDVNNTYFDRESWKLVNGFDGKKYDALYERILMRPSKKDMLLLIICIIVVVILLVVAYDTYLIMQLQKSVVALGKVATATVTSGV